MQIGGGVGGHYMSIWSREREVEGRGGLAEREVEGGERKKVERAEKRRRKEEGGGGTREGGREESRGGGQGGSGVPQVETQIIMTAVSHDAPVVHTCFAVNTRSI